jgi:hypothetical protein
VAGTNLRQPAPGHRLVEMTAGQLHFGQLRH